MIVFALFAAGVGAVERSTMTPTVSTHVLGGPLQFQFRFDHRSGPVAEVGYRLRFDKKDFKRLPGETTRLLRNPFSTVERATRELISGADVGLYTLRFRLGRYLPLDSLLRPLSIASDAIDIGYSTVSGEAVVPPPPERTTSRRERLKLTPVLDDIEKSLQNEIRRGLLSEGFNLVVPAGQGATFSQKEAVYESLRKVNENWDYEFKKVPESPVR